MITTTKKKTVNGTIKCMMKRRLKVIDYKIFLMTLKIRINLT